MSGWIKVEKDLESDPRVIRMAKALDRRFTLFDSESDRTPQFDPCNACALPGVTLVVGALARVWMYADSHARDDDTLDLSTGELDEWLGIPGFCALMPADWLNVIDEHTIELPGYQEHNNTEAKKKALGQKRQEKYRHKQQRTSVTGRNAGASLDQTKTRPDQTKTISESRTRVSRIENPTDGQGEMTLAGGPPPQPSLPRARVFAGDAHGVFERCKASYPKGTYTGVTWIHAERCIGVLLDQGASPDELIANTDAYREQQTALGKVGTQFVLSPKSFFADGHWRGPFPLPASPAAPTKRIRLASDIAEEYEAHERAAQS